jgi:tRNA A37 threonylcarbamoyladenosine modification protein TsaB
MGANQEIWLSLDLSSPRGTLAIHRYQPTAGLAAIYSDVFTESGDHMETLIPHLERILVEIRVPPTHITKLITTSGPGSFTGLRIAIASLKAIAYVSKAPIELLRGSEARALTWWKNASKKQVQEIYVLTYITADRFVAAKFKSNPQGNLQFENETSYSEWSFLSNSNSKIILLDERIKNSSVPQEFSSFVTRVPLHANDLASTLLEASSRKSYQSIPEWISLSPDYFGSTRF